MSCPPCPCGLKWPVDVARREPCTSEKAWLDMAVRQLSREAVGRGRGQEAVWVRPPEWWAADVGQPGDVGHVGLAWKNPTANPKDTKEVLQRKYTALATRLTAEGRFPATLQEEARLWEEGKVTEMFLLTSLTSLLVKATGVHHAALGVTARVTQLRAEVTQGLVRDIRACLGETLKVIDGLCPEGQGQPPTPTRPVSAGSCQSSRKMKRSRDSQGQGSEEEPTAKVTKVTEVDPAPDTQKVARQTSCHVVVAQSRSQRETSRDDITSYSKKLIQKRQQLRKEQTSNTNIPSLPVSQIESRASPICINLSESDLQLLLQGQTVPFPNLENKSPVLSEQTNTITQTVTHPHESLTQNILDFDSLGSDIIDVDSALNSELVETNVSNTSTIPDPSVPVPSIPDPSIPDPSLLDPSVPDPSSQPVHEVTISSLLQANDIDDLDTTTSQHTSELDITTTSQPSASTTSPSVSPSLPHSLTSDPGYGSDEGMKTPPTLDLDIDSLFSQEEQTKMWQDDDAFLVDPWMLDL